MKQEIRIERLNNVILMSIDIKRVAEHEVHINRVHKGSPYNCAAVIPSIQCMDREKVIDLPEVRKLIGKTYGKLFIVQVMTNDPWEYGFLEYEVEKTKAVIKL